MACIPLALLVLCLASQSRALAWAAPAEYFKLKVFDERECKPRLETTRVSIFPTNTCLYVQGMRLTYNTTTEKLEVYTSSGVHDRSGCVRANLVNEVPVMVGQCEVLDEEGSLFAEVVTSFSAGEYQLEQDENIVSAFTSCTRPEFGYYAFALFKEGVCYSYTLDKDGWLSETFTAQVKDDGVIYVVKTDYKDLYCSGQSRATEYIVGECAVGHFIYSTSDQPQQVFGQDSPNTANPFSDDQPNGWSVAGRAAGKGFGTFLVGVLVLLVLIPLVVGGVILWRRMKKRKSDKYFFYEMDKQVLASEDEDEYRPPEY
ncbi:hypothetical protein HOP50_17g80850 [Chloropicon primus]|uniref:Uncharacterized protein n=1 Tax=Chloropicon primus TaxID=1764295 RepID=A0A5B8MY65_9CHLO|nr:hypothetical protein A3770_17p80610 [Chloropicon primus]UPR04740.1 hypothetical protein HOP50_17g80850 [Chloropicon primus]|mmetsp:Transcript_11982/g.33141  ORF Transcript_11982/g.33141 Transcript_11982/m.33141 type:complete len:315 (+) Transcript_11982:5051-5995(+)|eukprot:QDZ25543.1 hypothetical protein A3770_17p80610 [Chloropicon primus]